MSITLFMYKSKNMYMYIYIHFCYSNHLINKLSVVDAKINSFDFFLESVKGWFFL